MNIAPIQMVDLAFRKLSVEVDFDLVPAANETRDAHALLEGVALRTQVSCTPLEQEDHRGTPHFVTLRVQIDNELRDGEPEQRLSPYLLDVEAGAVIILARGAERLGDPGDLIAVNGPALIWGAIREQVATMTARMPAGTAMLPSVNFHDLKKSNREKEAELTAETVPAQASAKPKRARATKS